MVTKEVEDFYNPLPFLYFRVEIISYNENKT